MCVAPRLAECGAVRFCGRASGPVRVASVESTVYRPHRACARGLWRCGCVWWGVAPGEPSAGSLVLRGSRAAEKGGSPRAGRPPGRARAATRTTPTQGLVTPNAPSRQPRTARRASRSQAAARAGARRDVGWRVGHQPSVPRQLRTHVRTAETPYARRGPLTPTFHLIPIPPP